MFAPLISGQTVWRTGHQAIDARWVDVLAQRFETKAFATAVGNARRVFIRPQAVQCQWCLGIGLTIQAVTLLLAGFHFTERRRKAQGKQIKIEGAGLFADATLSRCGKLGCGRSFAGFGCRPKTQPISYQHRNGAAEQHQLDSFIPVHQRLGVAGAFRASYRGGDVCNHPARATLSWT